MTAAGKLDDPLPLRHASLAREVARFRPPAGCALEEETPLFCADAAFARQHGGPITRAFVDALPPSFAGHALLDSSLVWLTPGIAHLLEPVEGDRAAGQRGAPRFVHEQFPGVVDGMRGAANRDRRVLRRLCVLGADCTPELAEGELSFGSQAEADAFWLPVGGLEARERQIERWLEQGRLARRGVPLETIIEYGWGTLLRSRPARSAGFQLLLRAAAFDERPVVNGRRNLMAM